MLTQRVSSQYLRLLKPVLGDAKAQWEEVLRLVMLSVARLVMHVAEGLSELWDAIPT